MKLRSFSRLVALSLVAATFMGNTEAHSQVRIPDSDRAKTAPLQIGNNLQLFVDKYLIGSMHNVTLKLHAPQPAGVAIRFDKPWEGNVSTYVTVFRDGNIFRMYYRCASLPSYIRKSALKPGEVIIPKHRDLTCYAQSKDGIVWTKPDLGLVKFHGSTDNNIILDGGEFSANFSPFLDTNPQAPASARYKAVAGGNRGLVAFESADGIHWKKVSDRRILTDGTFDSLNVVFWDSRRKEYVAIYRDFVQGIRTLKHATSKDFVHWTPGTLADYGDTPPEQLYTNATTDYFRAPQIYLAFPMRFLPWRNVFPDSPNTGISDGVFMSSRDGIHWNRRFLQAYVRPGRDPLDWVNRDHIMATGILATAPGQLSLYTSRHYTYPSAFLQRLTVRTDGFVSVHAGYHGGSFTTKPFILDGNYLVLNYATSAAGSIQWELLDENGYPLPGFSREQTKILYGDQIARRIELQNPKHTIWHELGARPVRLRFFLKDADLYSLRIAK